LRIAVLIGLAATIADCSRPTSAPIRVFRRPIGLAVTCSDASGNPVPPASCAANHTQTGWVLDADRSAIGILSLPDGVHLDTDPFLPGFNPLSIHRADGQPLSDLVEVRAAADSRSVFVLSRRDRALVRIDPKTLSQALQVLPCSAESFELLDAGPLEPSAIAACPDLPGLVAVPLEAFGEQPPETLRVFPTSGRPANLAASPDGAFVYLTHRSPDGAAIGFLSRVDLATGVEDRAGLMPECSDGLDNDSDGLVDARDPGCTGPEDESESPDSLPECLDGLDNDADGRTDLSDPDCGAADRPVSEFPYLPWPECSNGLDDDQDGHTDWPDDPDCYGPVWSSEVRAAPRVAGRPAVSPDADFVYVPLTNPAAIAVLRSDRTRVDVNDLSGPAPNPLLHRLGVRDIPLSSPVLSLAMTATDQGVRAFAGLASGQVVSIVVTRDGAPVHRLDVNEDSTLASSTSLPVLRVAGRKVGTLDEVSSEYPSFGSSWVAALPGEPNRFSYYGIVFGGNPELELPETWHVTYEGVIPGTEEAVGFLDLRDASLRDPRRNFCALGVSAGDHVVWIEPSAECLGAWNPPVACPREASSGWSGTGLANLCEVEVAEVRPDRLVLREIPGHRGLDVFPASFRYEVRVHDQWTVVGTRSGFLHNQVAVADHCEERADADLRFTGRARTSRPVAGGSIETCPVRAGATGMDWQPFTNPSFTFTIFPPCRTSAEALAEACAEVRDTEISFGVASGQAIRAAGTGGFPSAVVAVAERLYAVDSASGSIHQIDRDSMSLVQTVY